MRRYSITVALLLVLAFVAGCGEHNTTAPAADSGQSALSTINLVAVAEPLANGTIDAATYQRLLYLSEDERATLRSLVHNYLSDQEIAAKDHVYAIVGGPAFDGITTSDQINALGRETALRSHSAIPQSTSGWVLYINLPFYSQRDSNWGSHLLGYGPYGSSDTIYNYGCYLCCICELYAMWGVTSATPPVVNDWQVGSRQHYAFAANTDLIRIPEALQYPPMCRPFHYIQASQIWGEVAAGHPVTARTTQYGGHYVNIFAHDGSRYWEKDTVQNAANQNQPLTGDLYPDGGGHALWVFGY